MELRELLSGEVESISGLASVSEGAAKMHDAGVGSLAVMIDGRFEGILTERDVLEVVADGADPGHETIADWMTAYPDSFVPDMDVREAADWMLAAGYRHLPVVEGRRLIGMASIKDVLWALTTEPAG